AAILTDTNETITIHPSHGLRDGRARVSEPLRNTSAKRNDALFFELENGSEIHLRRVDEVSHYCSRFARTNSMLLMSWRTSFGSIETNVATRSWLRPSLR